MRSPRPSQRSSNIATYLALIALVAFAGFLLALVAMVLPQAIGLIVVIGGMFFFGAFHYLVWGWWLTETPTEEEDETF
jgi:CHASE2 domain-containing sensor protein